MTVTIAEQNSHLKIVVLPIDQLKPHEKGSPLYLELIKREILKDGMLKYPVIADEKTHVILDGMHRWLALKTVGCTLIPVLLVDAANNGGIRVGTRRIHRYLEKADGGITVEKVLSAGLSENLMKPRSTRHFFPFSKFQRIDYPLHLLKNGSPQDVKKYLAATTSEECETAIKQWLEELSEELEFLAKRKEEVENEMREFLNRISTMNK